MLCKIFFTGQNQSHFQNSLSAKEVPKGFEKNIIRMRYAIDETRKKKEALEKFHLFWIKP